MREPRCSSASRSPSPGCCGFHPIIGDYEGLRDVTTRFKVVHVAMVLVFTLLALGIYACWTACAGARPTR
jgi:hypothetical protein